MRESLRALLAGAIDYAGLFPPAGLPLDQAVRNYAGYRTGAESRMLGRFVIPATRLAELSPYRDLFATGSPFVFSALGRGGATAGDFLAGLGEDLHDIAAFRARYAGAVEVDVFEVRLPAAVRGDGPILRLIGDAAGLIEERGPPALMPFYEAPPGERGRLDVQGVMDALKEDAAAPRRRCPRAGFKLRCGGLEAAAFPTAEQVARALACARDREVPLKFTAGLHHPLRRFDAGVQTHMHGFLNVMLAGVFAVLKHADEAGLVRMLLEEDATAFAFEDGGVRWGGIGADLGSIERVRREFGLSFGSCSFDEPRDDLRALGLH